VGALLVSPFNVAWGCYAWDKGVEESEFYVFLVVFPAKRFSSVSPRFYFRKHAFCFLPLVAILESFASHSIGFRLYHSLNFKMSKIHINSKVTFYKLLPFQ
jgi:hypothetical protein